MSSPSDTSHRIVILGAGQALSGGAPNAVRQVRDGDRVLDWQLAAFAGCNNPEFFFVGGFKLDQVEHRYPNIRFRYNRDWQTTGPVHSLAQVPLTDDAPLYVVYGDIVFRPGVVRALEKQGGDIGIAIDRKFRTRYDSRTQANLDKAEKVRVDDHGAVQQLGSDIPTPEASAEFAGVVRLSTAAIRQLAPLVNTLGERATIPAMLAALAQHGLGVGSIDVAGDWAELDAPQDLARFVLGTKAESLDRLQGLLNKASIGDQVSFTYEQWQAQRAALASRVQAAFRKAPIIIRSSALAEDNWHASNAGRFESLLDVSSADLNELGDAVDTVFASYGEPQANDQVLIQEMLRGVQASGVVMTRTPSVGAPYHVINFDTSSRTDTVTGGSGKSLHTLFHMRGQAVTPAAPPWMEGLLDAVAEVEELVGHDSLDIEFGITHGGPVHIMQVRPIAVAHRGTPVDDDEIGRGIARAARFFERLQANPVGVLGDRTQLSVMADWNPAEMIGTKPSPLALSLYRHLITDETWALQRAEYGYRDVRPANLLVNVLGHPYIDVRVDFNSFLPANLNDDLAGRLVNYYVDLLRQRPELHDKVEFDILLTCALCDFDEQATRLSDAGFSTGDIAALKTELWHITQGGIARTAADVEAIAAVETRCRNVLASDLAPLDKAHALIEDTRRQGVLLFSHLARHAFVAMSLLRSLVRVGAINQDELDAYLGTLQTVPNAMLADARQVSDGKQNFSEFVDTYGHLRPGTYDITSPTYGAQAEEFLRPVIGHAQDLGDRGATDGWSTDAVQRIDDALAKAQVGVDAQAFIAFAKQAIEGREFGKFAFTRGLSAALECIAAFGQEHGFSRSEMALTSVRSLFELKEAGADPKGALGQLIATGRQGWNICRAVELPGQVREVGDFTSFMQPKAQPNFVSQKTARAAVVFVGEDMRNAQVSGRIVLIANADPGYDWLFSQNPAGLITMYGGVNSHMAIRAAEFEMPAAIGVGEVLYEHLSRASVIELDCSAQQIRVVR